MPDHEAFHFMQIRDQNNWKWLIEKIIRHFLLLIGLILNIYIFFWFFSFKDEKNHLLHVIQWKSILIKILFLKVMCALSIFWLDFNSFYTGYPVSQFGIVQPINLDRLLLDGFFDKSLVDVTIICVALTTLNSMFSIGVEIIFFCFVFF